MNKQELIEKLQDIEWEDFEVKEAQSEIPKSSWESVSAFANTNGGWLIFGVKKEGKKYFIQGVKTSEKVWFYDMEADGFSLDDKRTPQPEKDDIPDILERFTKRNNENNEDRAKKHFFAPLQEIKDNDWDLSINKYRKEEQEEIIYRDSKVIIKEAKKEVKDLLEGFEELEKLV